MQYDLFFSTLSEQEILLMPEIMTYAASHGEDSIDPARAEPGTIHPATRPYLSHEQIQHLVAARGDTFSLFKGVVRPLFEAMLEEETEFSRGPNVSLRLPAQGTPAAWVLVRPCWDRRRKEVRSGMTAETVFERLATSGIGCGKPLPHVEVAVELGERNPRWTLWSHQHGEMALETMTGTMAEFVEDPAVVLARSSNRCCLCGRRLTDEVSRGRGVGPECIQKYHSAFSRTKC